MVSELPEPPVTVGTNITGLDGFLLHTDRLMASELWALATGEEFKAAVGLWCRAWKQSPPGSLPDDNRVLAGFSGAGARWLKVRGMALRGFVKCSDGRLYHTVLCDDVLRVAKNKVLRHKRTKAATEARIKHRNDEQKNNINEKHDERDVHVTRSKGKERKGKESNKTLNPGYRTSLPLPGWLDLRVWEEYKAHRKALRAGLTPQAEEKQLKALAKIHAAGRDPNAAIEHSIAQGWRGIFEPTAKPKEKDGAEEYLSRFRNDEKEITGERDE